MPHNPNDGLQAPYGHIWIWGFSRCNKDLECRTVAEIQAKVIKQSGRNIGSRLLHARNNKDKIAAWKQDLNEILQIFNVCALLYMFDCFSLPAFRLN